MKQYKQITDGCIKDEVIVEDVYDSEDPSKFLLKLKFKKKNDLYVNLQTINYDAVLQLKIAIDNHLMLYRNLEGSIKDEA